MGLSGIWSDLKKSVGDLSESAKTKYKTLMSKKVKKATMYATAWVSTANGEMKDSEVEALHTCIREHSVLKNCDPMELQELFDEAYKGLAGSMKFAAQSKVIASLQAVEKGSEAAIILVGICCEIANADGVFDDKEKEIVGKICKELNVDPSQVGLTL